MRKRREKNITVYDIPGNIYPARMLDELLRHGDTGFTLFFYRSVIVPAQEWLYQYYRSELGRDDERYGKFYIDILCSDFNRADGRVWNAVRSELGVWESVIEDGLPRVHFLDAASASVSARKQVKPGKGDSPAPVRVQMDIRDKLDLRVMSAMHGLALWEYIGEAMTEGMLKLYILQNTSPSEKGLLAGNVDDGVDTMLGHDAMLAVFDRLVCGYYDTISRCYSGAPPVLRQGVDEYALDRLRESIFDRGDLWH